ncbi:hypothetical protein D3C86_1837020 [compost metagenome]
MLAVTEAKTVDAVYAHLEDDHVVRFSRTEPAPYEWANLSWLPPAYCEVGEGAVFERMERDLPIAGKKIISYEVDREADLESARVSIAKHL